MKHFSFLRLITLLIVFFTAMAFSCQDHHIPEPVTNCNRIDGTPRAFDCEFEFVKAEFYRVAEYGWKPNDTLVYATATSANPNVQIKEPRFANWIVGSRSGLYFIQLPVKVTIKRIAPSPSNSATYFLRKDFRATSNGVEFPTYSGNLPADDTHRQVKIDVPVGDTYAFLTSYVWSGSASFDGKYMNYHIDGGRDYLAIQNVETSKLLRQAPYNYSLYRDIAEAKLLFHPYIIPSSDPF
ncbi:MAG: hypothetical protein J7619_13245 [Dyadobacter sp.]|uniref:hypothetical protein n=1 Tax=Dyadobacter sp. TaxID=1914288 RepID=UPI001B2BF557|nr:hypothetical protein [Dyadobacter sp.]MBO9613661.1 hypothetical protein [Dyadobacter sp.]